MPPLFNSSFAETERPRASRPNRLCLRAAGKSPVARECVVADAVTYELVSASNSLVTGKNTGNFAVFDP